MKIENKKNYNYIYLRTKIIFLGLKKLNLIIKIVRITILDIF